jgi:hypothetical protein
MKNRIIRLALVGGLALAASGPLTSSASAAYCSPLAETVCNTYALICRHVPEGGKYDPHALLCESLA